MTNEFYYTLHQLSKQLERQEKLLQQLKKKQLSLQSELEEIKKQPPLRIDRIEYQFDQLKIDRLEGTLNIGLNPQDLQDMDEFSIDPLPFQQMQGKYFQQMRARIEEELSHYLDHNLPQEIEKIKEKLHVTLDDSYTEFIKQDIRKQLRERIEFYLKQQLQENRTNIESLDEHEIIKKMKTDIADAVQKFFEQFPMKGDWWKVLLDVTNKDLYVGTVDIKGVSGSSIVLVGDTNCIEAISFFDTPLESQYISPLIPIAPERD